MVTAVTMISMASPPQFQRGYLVEIPIILFLLVVVLSIVMPCLPLAGQKALIGIAAVPIVFCLFYMIFAPGWMPGESVGRRHVWRMALFLGCAAMVVVGAGSFILRS